LLRNFKGFIKISAKLTDASIFLLLFFLGVSVGMNESVINNFEKIGFQAINITLMALLGSLVVTALLTRFILKNRSKRN
jgi:putative effector of murein hydrolase LrgA (UPF0299 family)